MRTLYLIPARGGSKGIPKKNIKLLNGKPLIAYSIDIARKFANDADICVSTDDDEIINVVETYGLKTYFKRPSNLSTDTAGSDDVLKHSLKFFTEKGRHYDNIMLLQPTSPFRKREHLEGVIDRYEKDLDMVVSVAKSHHNPYFNLFEEDENGYLKKSKDSYTESRQQAPEVYAYNGSLYLINTDSLKKAPLHKFRKIKKYEMDDLHSVDIDTPLDWAICETILREGYINHENS